MSMQESATSRVRQLTTPQGGAGECLSFFKENTMIKNGALSFAGAILCFGLFLMGLERGSEVATIFNLLLASLNGGCALHYFAKYIRGE